MDGMKLQQFKSLALAVTLGGLMLTGLQACSRQGVRSDTAAADKAEIAPLNGDVLYDLLLGEFAGVRGNMDVAVDAYTEAALKTNDPKVAARAAQVAVYSKRYDKALEACDRWEQLSGENVSIQRVRVLSYLKLGKADKARAEIDHLLFPGKKIDPQALTWMSHVLSQEFEPADTLPVIQKIAAQHPGSVGVMLLQTQLELSAGLFDRAIATTDKAIKQDGSGAEVWLLRAKALAGLGKPDEALDAIGHAVDNQPQNYRLRLRYARMLVQKKRYDEAWDHFVLLRSDMPDNPDILLSLSLLSIETGRTQLALDYLQDLGKMPDYGTIAHYYAGRVYQGEKQNKKAIKEYKQVTEGNHVLDAQVRMAGLMAQEGQGKQALAMLKKLIKGESSSLSQVKLYIAQGEILKKSGHAKEALKLYNTALKQVPDNVDLLYARALTAETLDKLDITEKDLRSVLHQEPENVNALNALGYTLADRTQRLQEAKKYILKAASLVPDDPAILDSLGWVYFRLGKNEEAIKWLTKAYDKFNDGEIAAHLGEVLWVSGKKDQAQIVWDKALQKNPHHKKLLSTIKRLKQ